jgi:hypothetical protein
MSPQTLGVDTASTPNGSNPSVRQTTSQRAAKIGDPYYYWRWRIESDVTLLKSHGQQLEHWQQETGDAIFRRLLVATMACVTV